MNSRFKFRVWNIKHGFYCDQMTEMVINSNGVCYDNGVRADYFEYNGFVIEQCTGLKDKNGNLIYDGDVVKYYWETKTNTGFIRWNDDFAGFYVINNEEHCMESPHCLMYVVDTKNIEIIGNIHENKGE